MPLARTILMGALIFGIASPISAGPDGGTLTGIVTFKGTPPKRAGFNLEKEPACVKMHASAPLQEESVVTGRGNGLANVVVYISSGEVNAGAGAAPGNAVAFDQKDCHYKTHVLPVQVGQEIKIENGDPISHNIHPLAKVNREWNRMQPAGTPPFSYSYEKEEIIPVRCNIHLWMQGYFVVLKTSHFAVTGEDGVFRLPDLPQGKYTVTAWHETLGSQSQEIVVTSGETTPIYFTFPAKS